MELDEVLEELVGLLTVTELDKLNELLDEETLEELLHLLTILHTSNLVHSVPVAVALPVVFAPTEAAFLSLH